jgi:hypothetical protein
MSGVAVIRSLLADAAAVTAQVPAGKIYSGVIPLGAVLPAISVSQVSGIDRLTVGMTGTKLRTERVQVTVQSKTYPSQKSILALVRAACRNRSGTVNGVTVDCILPDVEGPDLADTEAQIYTQSQDFIVKWREAH